jgi:dihydroorotate dehydrogenase
MNPDRSLLVWRRNRGTLNNRRNSTYEWREIGVQASPNQETPAERVPAEFAELAARFSDLAGFIVVNVSSPNTANLRSWQTPDRLTEI